MKRFLVCMALLFASTGMALAQSNSPVPSLMNFQGRLARPDGTPVADGTYAIRFSLWDAASGGNEQWNQTIGSIPVHNGTFAVLLSGLSETTFAADRWLEIKIGTDVPLTPRQQVVSAAFAFKANLANTVPDGSISSAKLANSVLTAGGDLTGTYPAPSLATRASSLAKVSGNVLSSNGTNVALNANQLLLRSLSETNYGLGSFLTWNGSTIDGPVLYGNTGGALGTYANHIQSIALYWNTSRVGIGTTAPASLLHISNPANPKTGGNETVRLEAPVAGNQASYVHAGAFGDWLIRSANTAGRVVLQDGGGYVGVGTSDTQGYKFFVNGSTGGTDSWHQISDIRYKTNVQPIADALEAVLNLRGVTYDWKNYPGMNFPAGRQVGFIAQEVEKVVPELVATDAHGYKAVAYANLAPLLVEAIKTLQARAAAAQQQNEAEIAALKGRNAALEARLNAIEAMLAKSASSRK